MRRDSPAARRSFTEDPKKVCVKYTKGKCTKSHAECPYVRNPKCYWHTKGKCKKGANCLFPHRAIGIAVQRTEDEIALQLAIDESLKEEAPADMCAAEKALADARAVETTKEKDEEVLHPPEEPEDLDKTPVHEDAGE